MGAGGEGDNRGWDSWMASLTQWTWVWVNSGVGDGQGGLVCCDSWGRKESDTTEWLNWSEQKSRMCDLDEKRESEIWFNTVHLVEMPFFWPNPTMYALNIHKHLQWNLGSSSRNRNLIKQGLIFSRKMSVGELLGLGEVSTMSHVIGRALGSFQLSASWGWGLCPRNLRALLVVCKRRGRKSCRGAFWNLLSDLYLEFLGHHCLHGGSSVVFKWAHCQAK